MKLSQYQINIEQAYNVLLADRAIQISSPQALAFNYTRRRPAHALPRERQHILPPLPAVEYAPSTSLLPFQAKEKMVQLAAFQSTYHDSITPMTPDMIPLIIDTGASISISPCRSDFISSICEVQHVTVKGVASGLQARGIGDLSYSFTNNAGHTQTLLLRNCLYVPECAVRLICPRQIGVTTRNSADGFYATNPGATLIVDGQPTTIRYDSLSQLPILFTKPGILTYLNYVQNFHAFNCSTGSVINASSTSSTYMSYAPTKVSETSTLGLGKGMFPGVDPSLATEPDPLCASCCFGKSRRLTHKTHTGHISKNHVKPGQGVSSDGLESGTPGWPFTTKGSASTQRYNYVSIWVDHMSTFVYITFHSSKAASKLVRSKTEFEQYAARFNVKIENVRADNGIYSFFRDSCLKQQQILTFCAVGAHWQNRIAERYIGTITQRARTILLNAMAKWPTTITEDMWTFALRHAVHFHNSSVRKDSQITPYEAFTGQAPPWALQDFRVFSSPAYVLAKELQDGSSLNKWRSRVWQSVYIGNSTCHASAIPLIYNPRSTHISPQFHVVYDEYFYSVAGQDSLKTEAY